MDKQLLDILATAKTTTDLHTLADVSAVRNWDYSLPTLTQHTRFTQRKPWSDAADFKKAFFEKYPVLKGISFDKLAIMGGAVLSLLTTDFTTKDLDLFVVLDDEALAASPEAAKEFAENRIKQFIRDLYDFVANHNAALKLVEEKKQKTKPDFYVDETKLYELEEFRVRRVLNVYTVYVPILTQDGTSATQTIQLVSTPHATVSDLFRNVDIGCTAIAYYGDNLWFSPLSKFCYENVCFVVSGSITNPSYVDRVIKYFNRGFDIVMPPLDVKKIRTRNFEFGLYEALDLPALTIVVYKLKGNKVMVQSMKKPPVTDDTDGESTSSSAGGFAEYTQSHEGSTMHAGVIIHNNIRCLLHGTYDGFIVDGEGSTYANAFRPRPTITDRMLVNTFEKVKGDLYSNSTLNMAKLVAYFPMLTPAELLERTVMSYVTEKQVQKRRRVAFFDSSYARHIENVLDELVTQQIAIAKAKIVELEATPYVPSTATVEAQTTGKSPLEWFGEYYKHPTQP